MEKKIKININFLLNCIPLAEKILSQVKFK